MRRTVCLVIAGLVLAALAIPAAPTAAQVRTLAGTDSGPYFPLAVGNRWAYSRTGGCYDSRLAVSVTGRETAPNGRHYFVLQGGYLLEDPETKRLVRTGPRSTVTEFNPDGTADNLWYLLGAPVGTTWTFQVEPTRNPGVMEDCNSGGSVTVASRTDVVRVPAGEFRDVVRLAFRNHCYDAGVSTEWFAPGIGLIKREESDFCGAPVTELQQAEIGDMALPRQPYATSLSLDRPAYVNNLMPPIGPDAIPVAHAVFALRNRTPIPITFQFGGCVAVSIAVVNERGEAVLKTRATGEGCCLCDVILPITIQDGALAVPATFRLATPEGRPLPDGRYAVTATLESLDAPAVRPSATATIEITSVY